MQSLEKSFSEALIDIYEGRLSTEEIRSNLLGILDAIDPKDREDQQTIKSMLRHLALPEPEAEKMGFMDGIPQYPKARNAKVPSLGSSFMEYCMTPGQTMAAIAWLRREIPTHGFVKDGFAAAVFEIDAEEDARLAARPSFLGRLFGAPKSP